MIKLNFKDKQKELEFFKSIEKYNYLNDAGIKFAMMVYDDDDKKKAALFDDKGIEV